MTETETLELKIRHKKAELSQIYAVASQKEAELAVMVADYNDLTKYTPTGTLRELRKGKGHEKIEEAIIHYAECGFSVKAASRSMGLNPTTLGHRFIRLMELTGVDYRDYPEMIKLYNELKRQEGQANA